MTRLSGKEAIDFQGRKKSISPASFMEEAGLKGALMDGQKLGSGGERSLSLKRGINLLTWQINQELFSTSSSGRLCASH